MAEGGIKDGGGRRPGFPYARTAAIIGSFKQYYAQVLEVLSLFTDAGIEILSPKGAPIIREGIPFVRFTSDPPSFSDPEVQTVTLHRILRADFVFVVAPNGYVGKTTCYEVGRIIHAMHPIYFSNNPDDLPIRIPETHVVSAHDLLKRLSNGEKPLWAFLAREGDYFALERRLAIGEYLEE